MCSCKARIPTAAGSYLLALYVRRGQELQIGKLGSFRFPRGWYFYAGSAFGPGGLQARLSHHRKISSNCHWHIDYLRNIAALKTLYWQVQVNNEHYWSAALAEIEGASFPVNGFGSSDCRCRSHLIYLPGRIAGLELARTFGSPLVSARAGLAAQHGKLYRHKL